MSIFRKLSNDPKTGESTINGQPASKDAVRELMHQNGYWDGGEFILELNGVAVGLQPANEAAQNVVNTVNKRRGLFG